MITKGDRRYSKYLKDKYLKRVIHKMMGKPRGLTKSLKKIFSVY